MFTMYEKLPGSTMMRRQLCPSRCTKGDFMTPLTPWLPKLEIQQKEENDEEEANEGEPIVEQEERCWITLKVFELCITRHAFPMIRILYPE